MGQKFLIATFDVDLNYNQFVDLLMNTSYNFVEEIYNIFKNDLAHSISCGLDEKIDIEIPALITPVSLDHSSGFPIRVVTENASIKETVLSDTNVHHSIYSGVENLVSSLNSFLKDTKLPASNIDNVVYHKGRKEFYVKLGTPEPKIVVLQASLGTNLQDVHWRFSPEQ